jgi:hypothetical protein
MQFFPDMQSIAVSVLVRKCAKCKLASCPLFNAVVFLTEMSDAAARLFPASRMTFRVRPRNNPRPVANSGRRHGEKRTDRDLSTRNDDDHFSRVGIDLDLILATVRGPYIHGPVRWVVILFENHQEHPAAADGMQSDLLCLVIGPLRLVPAPSGQGNSNALG